MPKRNFIIMSMLVVAFLSCAPLAPIVEAEEQTKNILRTGSTVAECIFLEKGLYIKVIRSASDLCAREVEQHRDDACTQLVWDDIPFYEHIKGKIPRTEAYGVGNQPCKESIVVYKKKNPGSCFEYHSGCNTRYIPRG